jgi:hypothetical protein
MKQRKKQLITLLFLIVASIFYVPMTGICVDSHMDINDDGVVGMPDVIMTMNRLASGQAYQEKEISNVTGLIVSYLNQDDMQNGLSLLSDSFRNMGLFALTSSDAGKIVKTFQENSCATIGMEANQTLKFTFNDQPGCSHLTGIVKVQLNTVNEGISLTATFESLSTTRCTIDGVAELYIEFLQNELIIHCQSQSLNICNTLLNGDIRLHINLITQDVSIAIAGTAIISNNSFNGTVQADLKIDTNQSISGTATVISQEKTYHVTLTNVYIDPTCGIPTKGQIQFNMYQLDFSQTTCEKPIVTVSMGIYSFEMSIQEIIDMLLLLK